MRPDAPFRLLSRSANKIRFCNCVLNSPDEHLIKRTQTPETSETLDSTIRILIGALRFERRKTSTTKMFAKTYLRKVGAPMTNTTTEQLGAKRSLTYQRLHLSIPQKGRAEKPPKTKNWTYVVLILGLRKKEKAENGVEAGYQNLEHNHLSQNSRVSGTAL